MDTINQKLTVSNQEQIFETLTQLVSEIIGKDFIEHYDVTMDSTLTGDLEMESIEIVELSEKIKMHFGQKADFSNWMANLELEQIISLSMKDIVAYIHKCLS